MRTRLTIVTAFACWMSLGILNSVSRADDIKGWGPAARRAVALVSFLSCPPALCANLQDPRPRNGTGFLFQDAGGRVGVLTAYHVVAGEGRITYQFRAAGEAPYESSVIALDPTHDLALLELRRAPAG